MIRYSLCGVIACAGTAFAVSPGQTDDFESGVVSGWERGPVNPLQPEVVTEDENSFLRAISAGGNGPGSRMAVFNRAQWAGDYFTTGVTAISFDVRNSGDTDLFLRVGLRATTGAQAVTNDLFELAAGSGWTTATIDITDLEIFFGNITPDQVRANVVEMRIMSSQSVTFSGDSVAATLDIDNIRAIPVPGVGGLLALGGAWGLRRRR